MMIRDLAKSDLEQLLQIENAVHIAPWSEATFKACLQVGHIGWGLELNHQLVGFIVVAIHTDECHILNLCVGHEHQHQGYGRHLLTFALDKAKKQGVSVAYLEVRRSNSRAINLYKKMHFIQIGERKDYYPTVAGLEDALVFARSLFPQI